MLAANAKPWGAGLLAGIMIVAAGCGSDDDAAAGGASLDRALAERLAERSEAIAKSLDAGDVCDAAGEADDLARAVSDAEMPKELRAEAELAAAQLVNSVNCEREPVEEEEKQRDQEDEGEGEQGEGRGNGDGGDESSGPGSGLPPGHGGQPPGQLGQGAEGGFE